MTIVVSSQSQRPQPHDNLYDVKQNIQKIPSTRCLVRGCPCKIKMDEAVCQSTSRRVRVTQVSQGTIWCHGHLHPCILGIKHYHFKFTHTLNWWKWLYKEKEGRAEIHSDLELYIQDLELNGVFSTGQGNVTGDQKFSDECRSKNLTNPSNCITVPHVALKAQSKS